MDNKTDQKIDLVTEIAQKEGYFWGDEGSEAYFDRAEKHLETQWATIIGPFIDGIQYDTAVDLASGHGSVVDAGRGS
jgi:hypothetical protein